MTNILADSVSAQTTDQKPESCLTNIVKTFVFSVVVILVCAVIDISPVLASAIRPHF